RFEREMKEAAEVAAARVLKETPDEPVFEPEELQRKILERLVAAFNIKRVGMDEVELATALKISVAVLIKSINVLVARNLVYRGQVAFQGTYIPDAYYYR